MNLDNHNYYGENLEESEFGQIHAMHLSMNALSKIRNKIQESIIRPSAKNCVECGEVIPEARRQAVRGCLLCVICKTESEK